MTWQEKRWRDLEGRWAEQKAAIMVGAKQFLMPEGDMRTLKVLRKVFSYAYPKCMIKV